MLVTPYFNRIAANVQLNLLKHGLYLIVISYNCLAVVKIRTILFHIGQLKGEQCGEKLPSM